MKLCLVAPVYAFGGEKKRNVSGSRKKHYIYKVSLRDYAYDEQRLIDPVDAGIVLRSKQ